MQPWACARRVAKPATPADRRRDFAGFEPRLVAGLTAARWSSSRRRLVHAPQPGLLFRMAAHLKTGGGQCVHGRSIVMPASRRSSPPHVRSPDRFVQADDAITRRCRGLPAYRTHPTRMSALADQRYLATGDVETGRSTSRTRAFGSRRTRAVLVLDAIVAYRMSDMTARRDAASHGPGRDPRDGAALLNPGPRAVRIRPVGFGAPHVPAGQVTVRRLAPGDAAMTLISDLLTG